MLKLYVYGYLNRVQFDFRCSPSTRRSRGDVGFPLICFRLPPSASSLKLAGHISL